MSAPELKQAASPFADALLADRSPGTRSSARADTPWLTIAVLFAGSGCAALIYEVVWFQMLQLVIGSTAVSIGVLLGSFMGGMCAGSLVLPRLWSAKHPPLRLWAMLELGIAGLGLAMLVMIPCLGRLYAAVSPGGFFGMLFRGALGAVCLVPPTMLMGATLPIISRMSVTSRAAISPLSIIYSANTLGAMLGALAAGFFLLRIFDTITASCVAAGLNVLLALVGLGLSRSEPDAEAVTPDCGEPVQWCWPVCGTIALSGFCALGAEVIWTRLLSLMLGGTTYTFSMILGVFLLGLAIGSTLGSIVANRSSAPHRALSFCQLLVGAAIAWAALMLARSLPYWPLNPTSSKNIWYDFQIDFLRCLWAILPATCLWGATFPLALAAAADRDQEPGRLVARLYSANTIGAILGSLAASILFIRWLGTQHSQQVLIVLSAVAGLVSFRPREAALGAQSRSRIRIANITKFSLISGLIGLLVWSVAPVPWDLIAYGRYLPMKTELGKKLFVAEGMNASVAVTELDTGVRNFHVSGKIEASTDQQDMRLQRMLAHLPALFHPDPHSVLVVGCGAGVTAGSFLTHPGIDRIKLCEIEPIIPKAVARFFGQENYDVVESPRVRIVFDDARHYLFTTKEKFDVITSDPIHPWVKGAAALYTREYFELCRRHLNPGGMVTQWVPLYESDLATVKSELATFFEVFPEGTIWANDNMGEGYDLVLLGQSEPLEVDVETIQQRLNRPDHAQALQSLRDVGIRSAFSLAANYAGQARDLAPWLKNAQINHDRDLRLQYLAGLGLNNNQADLIYNQLSDFRRFPDEIFVGNSTWNEGLRRALAQPKRK
jgi:spermidine synthase